jgi:hypothetical protein
MPEISRFFGIIITMNYNDHAPPHFHVRYSDHKALISIQTLTLLEGRLPPRVFGLIMEWASRHQAELMANWLRARQQAELHRIEPLE